MKVGMLWLDRSRASLEDKVRQAAARYFEKYNKKPNVCYIHPDALAGNHIRAVDDIVLKVTRSMASKSQLWIGVEDEE